MGVGSSKSKKPKEKPITTQDLEILLKSSQENFKLNRSKINIAIKEKENEIADCLIKNDIEIAKAKMNNILKDENKIAVYDILEPFLENLKGKCSSIISNGQCPAEIKSILDTVLFASTHIEIDGLKSFREKIIKKYGNEYVTKAENNTDQLVNEDLIEKLQPQIFREVLIDLRLKQLCKIKNIKCSFSEDQIPGDNLFPNDLTNKNPYASTIIYPESDNKKGDDKTKKIQNSNLITDKIDNNSYKIFTQITSDVNGLYCKTKVTQKFSNPLNNPLELKIYIFKKQKIIFSSFDCQIGDSIKVKSKVIKEEKAQRKYIDSIASGNAAIFVVHDENNKDIIINMGNIRLKQV